MGIYDSLKKAPANRGILAQGIMTGMNGVGGWAAGRLRGTIAAQAPTIKGAGAIGIFLIAWAIRVVRGNNWYGEYLREFAAGMAGYVGNDMWLILKQLVGWGQWKPETDYKTGDVVTFEKNLYKAEKDIPSTPKAEPGKDARWIQFEMAQAITMDDVSAFAQALNTNDALLDGLVKEQLLIFGPELAQCAGRELNQDEANNIYSGMRDSLKTVVSKFATAA